MSREPWRPKRRRLVLAGTFLGVTALALFLSRMSPQTSQGAGSSTLNNLVAVVNISSSGACNPGTIATTGSVGTGTITTPTPLPVTTPVSGCISRAGCPETIVIQDQGDPSKVERFSYANVSALTVNDYIDAGSSGFNLRAENLPPPPTTLGGCLEQHDLPATPNSSNCVLGNFPAQGYIFVDGELLSYDGLVLDSSATPSRCAFSIVGRGQMGTAAVPHYIGSLIRAANKLELLGRGVPKYPAASYTTPTPTFAAHATGDSVHSPKTYSTCRVTLSQPSPPGGAVTAASTCNFIQEPGDTENLCATPLSTPAPARTACFWSLGRVPADYTQQGDQYWVSTSVQYEYPQTNQTTVALVANVQPSVNYCFPYLEGLLWAKEEMTLTFTKSGSGKSYSDGTGTFAINIYRNDQCTGTQAFVLTDGAPNVVARTVPSPFLQCAADLQQTLDGRALCYLNSPGFVTNKPAAGSVGTCPPANPKFCGDGIYNDPPPGCAQAYQVPTVTCKALPAKPPSRHDCAGGGTSPDPASPCDVTQYQYLHVDKSAHMQGALNNATNKFDLYGCLEDPHGHQAQGAVYVELLSIDPQRGEGKATVWLNQTNTPCMTAATNHSTAGLSGTPITMDAIVLLQDPSSKPPAGQCTPSTCFDSDGDGCYDRDELQIQTGSQTALEVAKLGGLRDPQNPFDYPDVPITSNQHKIRVDDVTYVVNRYRHDMNVLPVPVNPYEPKADHTALAGSNAGETWHLGPPNGQVRVDDVTSVVNQYRHDCS